MPVITEPSLSELVDLRIPRLESLYAMLRPVPAEWAIAHVANNHEASMECLPCSSYQELVSAWRKAMKWSDGLDHALPAMLASVSSVQLLGDPIWLKVVSPASTGKSILCEAISVNTKYILAKSTLRGFHSGYRAEGGDDEDHSLISQLNGKTFVTKDGDTLLQSPNLSQILAEGRDIYDGTSRTHYRNAMSRDYENIRMTWILCGTSSLRAIDSSELGERFLDCVIMHGIDEEVEQEVALRVAHRAARNMGVATNGDGKSHHEPEMAYAMSLTGGYIDYLREHAADTLTAIDKPDWALLRCTRLAKFVALMRSRPSRYQQENAEREFSARLTSQLTRLAGCLALVLNRQAIDEGVMNRVKQIAMDTSRGNTFDIAEQLYRSQTGLLPGTLAGLTNQSPYTTTSLLGFLKAIGVVESFLPQVTDKIKLKPHWRLTKRTRMLFHEILEDYNPYAEEG